MPLNRPLQIPMTSSTEFFIWNSSGKLNSYARLVRECSVGDRWTLWRPDRPDLPRIDYDLELSIFLMSYAAGAKILIWHSSVRDDRLDGALVPPSRQIGSLRALAERLLHIPGTDMAAPGYSAR